MYNDSVKLGFIFKQQRKVTFMKTRHYMLFLLLIALIFHSCSSAESARGTASIVDGMDITARGAIGRVETAITGPMY